MKKKHLSLSVIFLLSLIILIYMTFYSTNNKKYLAHKKNYDIQTKHLDPKLNQSELENSKFSERKDRSLLISSPSHLHPPLYSDDKDVNVGEFIEVNVGEFIDADIRIINSDNYDIKAVNVGEFIDVDLSVLATSEENYEIVNVGEFIDVDAEINNGYSSEPINIGEFIDVDSPNASQSIYKQSSQPVNIGEYIPVE